MDSNLHKVVFIGGPITNLTIGMDFDPSFKELLLSVINIFQEKGYAVKSAHVEEKFGQSRLETDDIIVKRDTQWIDEADICVFLFPTDGAGMPVRTDGTYIELGYAACKAKKNIVFWSMNHKNNYSPMFRGMTEKNVRFYDISQIKEVLKNIE